MKIAIQNRKSILSRAIFAIAFFVTLNCPKFSFSQEQQATNEIEFPNHNQLFFNRFLINPTFSLVRENKSYLSILHRNQYLTFDDNNQNYYLGFSNKLDQQTAMGLGIYVQWFGVVQEFGFNANYAKMVKLGELSSLTFGSNFTYLNKQLDKNRLIAVEEDPLLSDFKNESNISIQPGITLTLGNFDFSVYAYNLIRYSQSTDKLKVNLGQETFKASLQYTFMPKTQIGILKNSRLIPLLQINKDNFRGYRYSGSILFESPKYGWFQATLDNKFGVSTGFGLHLSKKLMLGYLVEKDVLNFGPDLGWNHELSLAYTLKSEESLNFGSMAHLTDDQIDELINNYEEQILELKKANDDQASAKDISVDMAYENRLLMEQLIIRQDSVEKANQVRFERQFTTLVRTIRREIRQQLKKTEIQLAPNKSIESLSAKTEGTKAIDTNSSTLQVPIREIKSSKSTGVPSGYYIVINVFQNEKYMDKFISQLADRGIEVYNFYNKDNGLNYVYLFKYTEKTQAKLAVSSGFYGQYSEEKWILQIEKSPVVADSN